MTKFGDSIVIYGGIDNSGNTLDDMFVLDLPTMKWSQLNTMTVQTPRTLVLKDDSLYILGGLSLAKVSGSGF
jgi:Galactose oxidase, central domain